MKKMNPFRIIATAIAVCFATAAQADCNPSFVDGSATIRLIPPTSFSNDLLIEPFQVRIKNSGDEACVLRLGVGRRIPGGSRHFPAYSVTGPDGKVPLPSLAGAANNVGYGTEFIVPAGEQVALSYDVRMNVGWGFEAGIFTEDLVFQIFEGGPERPVITQDRQLLLEIPKMALIRFAGISGLDGPALIEMGALSPNAVTNSPPFALRVLSTSAYRMELISDNGGALRQINGDYLIPYALSLGGKKLKLGGASEAIVTNRHTSSLGDVHRVEITVRPNPEYPAGEYSDRVFVTVTAM